VVNGSAVDTRLKAMANKSSLPTKAELDALIELLASMDDDADEVNSAGESLTGADVTNLAEDLVGRLERGVAEMRSQGERGAGGAFNERAVASRSHRRGNGRRNN